jgi:hypothetical protein
MKQQLSLSFYRLLIHAYPPAFRGRFAGAMDQAFRDLSRDAFAKRGLLGMALLWLHVIPDFLFSLGEHLTRQAGDFLKWRFRLQWVLACSAGFAMARCFALLLIDWQVHLELERMGLHGAILGAVLKATVLMASLGFLQSRVLAGRCFRRTQWMLYGIAGMAIAIVLTMLLLTSALSRIAQTQVGLLRMIALSVDAGFIRGVAERLVTAPSWLVVGGFIGLLQASAVRTDSVSRYRWMRVCALGYFLSALAGGFAIPYPIFSVLELILTSMAAGLILGLVTARPLEEILFNLQTPRGAGPEKLPE